MANRIRTPDLDGAGAWAKRYFLASRALMDSVLRPYDLGHTQWYVLQLLAINGPLNQREVTRLLEVERATLSTITGVLVRKGLIEQLADDADQRQKVLRITAAGTDLWSTIPDPIELITTVAFAGVDPTDLATAQRVLSEATERLVNHRTEIK
ncbi:MarR family transcriptional regulator [Kribbella pratensis]|uniref:MarR family transcriptional regulator n=1 Tax=Kribbella pratensis TaxID=2512112 RepID=A0ABY2FI27_9ACTN|nr:MarR family transcriptional regulator [Kribbella pratensis]